MKPDRSYLEFISSLKQEIVNSRYQLTRLANRKQLILYFKTGKVLSDKAKAQNGVTKAVYGGRILLKSTSIDHIAPEIQFK